MLTKGEETRRYIVANAYLQARSIGLEGLTIGQLATQLNMSKSGLFAHFGSKEELQLAVLIQAAEEFVVQVLRPAISAAVGVERIKKVFELWVRLTTSNEREGGCIFIAAAADFDDKPGVIRDYVCRTQTEWRNSLERLVADAVKHTDLPKNTDTAQMAFELFSLVLACHHDLRLLDDPNAFVRATTGLERLLANPPLQ